MNGANLSKAAKVMESSSTEESSAGGTTRAATYRVKLFVHGGSVNFTMVWPGTTRDLLEHFQRNLAPRAGGIYVETPDKLTHIKQGTISAYEISKDPGGSGPDAHVSAG